MEFFKNLKFAWNYAKDQKKNLIWFIIVNILIIVISVVVPILSAKIIVYLTDNEFHQLLLIAFVILLIEWFRNVCNYFKRHNSNILFRETYINLQTCLGKEILKIENKDIDSTGSGLFIQRLTNDTSKLSEIFPMLVDFLTNIITDVGIFAAIFIINKVVFVYIIVMTIILYLVERKAEEKWGKGIVEQLSLDLQNEFPDEKGFSARNLWNMKKWYLFYSSSDIFSEMAHTIE